MSGWFSACVCAGMAAAFCRPVDAACCYFSAKETDVLQPAQKVFITWNPTERVETFTVQPKFQGDARDFGMVIPTPGVPKLDEMPKDFFTALAVFTVLKKPISSAELYPALEPGKELTIFSARTAFTNLDKVTVLENGIVGGLDYKIVKAEDARQLFTWLAENRYRYEGDTDTLDYYVKKKWVFTVMKIDTNQMRRDAKGHYVGEVAPIRFKFHSAKPVYPLRITALSVKGTTEALFYVQAPFKADLKDDFTWQYQWLPMISAAQGCSGFTKSSQDFVAAAAPLANTLAARATSLGFNFSPNKRPEPNAQGRTATTLEWGKRLTDDDLAVLIGRKPYGAELRDLWKEAGLEKVRPGDKAGMTEVARRYQALVEKERASLSQHVTRTAPAGGLATLGVLVGHLEKGRYLTKFRKVFTKGEMTDDLELVPAAVGKVPDESEYDQVLPASPP